MASIRTSCIILMFTALAFVTGCIGGKPGTPTPVPGSSANIYAAVRPDDYEGPNKVVEFPATSNGPTTPSNTLTVQLTSTESINGVAVDSLGNLYVNTANGEMQPSGPYQGNIRIYPPGASGSATPTRTIAGQATGLYDPSIGVDSSGLLYAVQGADIEGLPLKGISVFAANADGNVAPIRTISGDATTLVFGRGPAFDSSNNIYVTNSINAVGGAPDDVLEFSSTASGNVAPIRIIAGSATGINYIAGIAVDSSGNIYVSSYAINNDISNGQGLYVGSILVFSSTANGNVAPDRVITGSSTMLRVVGSLKVDSSGNIFVTSDNSNTANPAPTILKFAPNANGNVAPIAVITSAAFTQPVTDIAIH